MLLPRKVKAKISSVSRLTWQNYRYQKDDVIFFFQGNLDQGIQKWTILEYLDPFVHSNIAQMNIVMEKKNLFFSLFISKHTSNCC